MDGLNLGLGLVKPIEELVPSTIPSNTNSSNPKGPQMMADQRRGNNNNNNRPQKEQAINCPRCNSTNTKFCYYNNYSLTQPRYFCKTCRRYWTEGGTLRNVPVGGGSRKNKRHPSSSSNINNNNNNNTTSTTTTTTTTTSSNNTSNIISSSEATAPGVALKNVNVQHVMAPQDLNLAFNHPCIGNLSDHHNSGNVSAMELLRSEMSGRSIGGFLPMQLAMQEYHQSQSQVQGIGFVGMQGMMRPTGHVPLGFPLDGSAGNNYGNLQERNNNESRGSSSRLLFPFEQLKPAGISVAPNTDATAHFEHSRGQAQEQETSGFWQGMIGGNEGSW